VTYYDIVDTASGNSKLTGLAPVLPPTAATGQRVYQSGQPIILKNQGIEPAFDFGGSVLITGAPADNDRFSIVPSSSQSVFATLAHLIGALEAPAGTPAANAKLGSEIGFALTNLDQSTDNILRVRAQVGSRMNEIESLGNLNEDLDLQYQQTLSDLQDLDYARAISDLTRKQTDLQAAQQSFVKISQLSLFNYL
jgi:flagellar hook-associated protein 3 FlgL